MAAGLHPPPTSSQYRSSRRSRRRRPGSEEGSVGEEEEEEEDPRPTSNAVLRVALTLCVILQVRDGDLGFKIYFSFFSLVSSFVNLEFSLVWFYFRFM